jgi:hypothetical protein
MLGRIKNPATEDVEDKRLSARFQENLDFVVADMHNMLQHCCNGSLPVEALAQQISSVVRGFGILALEMGSQRAHIQLETCSYGDRITPGELFKDESESTGGSDVQVDLVTQPCMVRIGDGREDLMSQVVISKGNVITLKHG